jgi:hypothetical protein
MNIIHGGDPKILITRRILYDLMGAGCHQIIKQEGLERKGKKTFLATNLLSMDMHESIL